MTRASRIAVAVGWGVVNHVLFVVAVATMVLGLDHGLRDGVGELHGAAAWVANAALLLQFPLLHSWLLSQRGRAMLARLGPPGMGRELAPKTFTLVASLQLLATFLLWSPSGVTVHEAHGAARWVHQVLFGGSWVLLVLAMRDAGLGIQTGSIGWMAVVRGRRLDYGPLPTGGLFRLCRQPVYVAFALTLWTGPVLTLDGLVLALAWTAYCVLGPLHKERRYLASYGEAFARYRERVPFLLPRLRV